jgi:sensor histidine kinase regulating citrate/malate metabolism
MTKEEILSLSDEEQIQLLNTASQELLDILSHSSSLDVVRSVANHMYTSTETLRRMYYEDNRLNYRYLTLNNPNAPEDILLHHKAERFYLLRPHLELAH